MAVADWTPSPGDVADHIRAFTRDANGNEAGVFTADTAVTEPEVLRVIASTVQDVAAAAGDVPESLYEHARATVALGAASEVIVDKSPDLAADLWTRYQAKLGRLVSAVREVRDAGTVNATPSGPSGRFPEPFKVGREWF